MKCMNNERKRDYTKWFEARKGQKSRGFEGCEETDLSREIKESEKEIVNST